MQLLLFILYCINVIIFILHYYLIYDIVLLNQIWMVKI